MAEIEPIYVAAPASEIESYLKAALSADEFAAIEITAEGDDDPFETKPQGDLAHMAIVVIEFVALAVAQGAAYDIAKKVSALLATKFPKSVKTKKPDGTFEDADGI